MDIFSKTLLRWATRPFAKALYDLHPELRDREALLRVRSDDAARSGGGFREGVDFYRANVWVRRAVQKVAENIAWLPLQIEDRETGETTADHELVDVFLHVNDSMDPIDLWSQWATDMLLGGESGLELVRDNGGAYREIWPRQPDQIYVQVAKGARRRYGGVTAYRIDDSWGDPYTVPPDEFVHFKFHNPANPWRGLSPAAAIRMSVMIDELSRAWSRLIFKRGARPDMAIIAPQGLTRTEREGLERRFAARYGGLDNAHSVVALEEGVTDVKPIEYLPRDTEWLEQREMSRTEIAAIYGVPEEAMGFGRDTYENFDTAIRAFWTLTLVPLVRSRDARLTEFARGVDLIEQRERVTTDLSVVDVLRDDHTEAIMQVESLFGMGVPFNRAAEFVGVNLQIDGGDVGYLPITLVQAGHNPREDTGTGALGIHKAAVPGYGSALHREIWQKKFDRVQPHEDDLIRRLARAFQEQQNEINRRLREGKAVGDKQNLLQLFDPHAQAEAWRREFGPVFAQALLDLALEEVSDLAVEIDFDLTRPEVQAEIGEILGAFARKVNDTTYNDLRVLFAEAEEEGATTLEIIDMLSAYWEGRKSFWSRERIARTTMTALNNAADEAVWSQSDEVIGSRWLAAIDNRTREAHIAAHGQGRRLGQMFDVGGEKLAYPGDASGSPEPIINCRCTRTAIVVGEDIEQ